jgi:hypothetical protein
MATNGNAGTHSRLLDTARIRLRPALDAYVVGRDLEAPEVDPGDLEAPEVDPGLIATFQAVADALVGPIGAQTRGASGVADVFNRLAQMDASTAESP